MVSPTTIGVAPARTETPTPPSSHAWPLLPEPIPDSRIPLVNAFYLDSGSTPNDPTIVWGTEVDMAALTRHIGELNRESDVLISPAHALIKAVGLALRRHPQMNRRVLARRLYEYRDVNAMMPLRNPREGGANLMLLRNIDTRSMAEIAGDIWGHLRNAHQGERTGHTPSRFYYRIPRFLRRVAIRGHLWINNFLHLPSWRMNEMQRSAPVLINYFAFEGAAPLRSFKPSRFPAESCTLSVTMGATESRPANWQGQLELRPLAPLFVRADHRVCDAFDLGRFAGTLRELLSNPAALEEPAA